MSSKALENDTSDPHWSKDYRDTKDVPWYLDSLNSKVTPEVSPMIRKIVPSLLSSAIRHGYHVDTFDFSGQTRALLENYSHIPPSDVLQHVAKIVSHSPCQSLHILVALRQGRPER